MLPIVATLISSGLGVLGNAVLAKGKEVIEEKLGVDLDAQVKSEEGLIHLKQLEIDHEKWLMEAHARAREAELRGYEIEVADRQGARAANATVATSAQAPWYQKALLPSMAVMVNLGFFGAMFTLLYIGWANVKIDTGTKDIIIYAFGAMTGGWMAVMSYLFGSSHGSRDNQAALANIAQGVSHVAG